MSVFVSRKTNYTQLNERCLNAALTAARAIPWSQLFTISLDDLATNIIINTVPTRIEIDLGARKISADDTRVRSSELRATPRGHSIWIPAFHYATVIRVHIPYIGDRGLFTYRPSTLLFGRHPNIQYDDHEIIITITGSNPQMPEIQQTITQKQNRLADWIAAVSEDIGLIEDNIRRAIIHTLTLRQIEAARANQLVDALDIPIKHVGALELPREPEFIALTSDADTAGRPEWRIADVTYEKVLNTIIRFAHALERRPHSALELFPNEETLRDWIMWLLNANYQDDLAADLFVAGEAVNGAGKTDILVRQHDVNAFIGECKFWHGMKAFQKAIDQLLSYTVWRDTKAALILFIKNQCATDIISKADSTIRNHKQFVDALEPSESDRRRDYIVTSPEDPERLISLALIPVIVSDHGRQRQHRKQAPPEPEENVR